MIANTLFFNILIYGSIVAAGTTAVVWTAIHLNPPEEVDVEDDVEARIDENNDELSGQEEDSVAPLDVSTTTNSENIVVQDDSATSKEEVRESVSESPIDNEPTEVAEKKDNDHQDSSAEEQSESVVHLSDGKITETETILTTNVEESNKPNVRETEIRQDVESQIADQENTISSDSEDSIKQSQKEEITQPEEEVEESTDFSKSNLTHNSSVNQAPNVSSTDDFQTPKTISSQQ